MNIQILTVVADKGKIFNIGLDLDRVFEVDPSDIIGECAILLEISGGFHTYRVKKTFDEMVKMIGAGAKFKLM